MPSPQPDRSLRLDYYRARYYNPTWGRFISEDPLPGVNLYQYVGDNPINHLDPLGLFDRQRQWAHAASERVFNVTCKCYWLCVPCNGEYIWSGNLQGLPFTYGTFIYTGGQGLRSGDVCFRPHKGQKHPADHAHRHRAGYDHNETLRFIPSSWADTPTCALCSDSAWNGRAIPQCAR